MICFTVKRLKSNAAREKKNRCLREKGSVGQKALHSGVDLQDICIFNLLQTIKDYDLQSEIFFLLLNCGLVLTAQQF